MRQRDVVREAARRNGTVLPALGSPSCRATPKNPAKRQKHTCFRGVDAPERPAGFGFGRTVTPDQGLSIFYFKPCLGAQRRFFISFSSPAWAAQPRKARCRDSALGRLYGMMMVPAVASKCQSTSTAASSARSALQTLAKWISDRASDRLPQPSQISPSSA